MSKASEWLAQWAEQPKTTITYSKGTEQLVVTLEKEGGLLFRIQPTSSLNGNFFQSFYVAAECTPTFVAWIKETFND